VSDRPRDAFKLACSLSTEDSWSVNPSDDQRVFKPVVNAVSRFERNEEERDAGNDAGENSGGRKLCKQIGDKSVISEQRICTMA